MKPIVKLINIPGFKYIQFFNRLGFGVGNLVLEDPTTGKKAMINFGKRELGIYIGKGGSNVSRDENTQSPTASA